MCCAYHPFKRSNLILCLLWIFHENSTHSEICVSVRNTYATFVKIFMRYLCNIQWHSPDILASNFSDNSMFLAARSLCTTHEECQFLGHMIGISYPICCHANDAIHWQCLWTKTTVYLDPVCVIWDSSAVIHCYRIQLQYTPTSSCHCTCQSIW